MYAWVKQAFGEKGGFTALFCEWSNNLVWFPTVLSFIASTFAFALTPSLATRGIYMFTVMMIAFWGTTAIAYFGEEASTRFGNVGVILGSIIPALLIIFLGLWWMGSGQAIVLPPFSIGAMVPTVNLSTLPFFASVILLFAGMEMAGFHALETRDPQKDFPRAMAISAVIIVVWIVGGLGILGTTFAFIVGLIPPSYFQTSGFVYVGSVLLGTFLLAVPPLVFLHLKNPSWKEKGGAS